MKQTTNKASDGIERREMLISDIELRIDGNTGAPTVEGYAAVFNVLSEPIFEWSNGRFREKVLPGAFTKTIREQNIPLLVEHADLPLATTRAGTLELREDDHGLHFRSVLDFDDPDVKRLVPKMKRGDMNKCSFGFYPVRNEWNEATKPRTHIVKEAKLYDVSIVSRPAYPATEARVRKALLDDGLDAESIVELFVRIRQGLPLEDDDMRLLRLLSETCNRHLHDNTTTDADVAPGLDAHPTDAVQPVMPISAPQQPLHPLSRYREQVNKLLEVTA